MLIFAAIVPHSPLLIPSIGRGNLKKLKQTVQALQDLEAKLYLTKPDVLVMISPHGDGHDTATTILLDEEYLINFKEFGDFSLESRIKPQPALVEKFRRNLRLQEFPVTIGHEAPLDHGFAVPLYYLNKHLPASKLIPLLPAHNEPLKKIFDAGRVLKEDIINEGARLAVIASADLSHKLSSDAPAGFSPKAKDFDEEVRKLLESKNSAKILQISPELMAEVEACGLRSIAMMLGIIDGVNTTTQAFSYEAPFGVGYLVANFKIH